MTQPEEEKGRNAFAGAAQPAGARRAARGARVRPGRDRPRAARRTRGLSLVFGGVDCVEWGFSELAGLVPAKLEPRNSLLAGCRLMFPGAS